MIINKRLENHRVNFNIIFDVNKQNLFFIPKEESQAFTSKEHNFTPGTTFRNNVYLETVNNDILAANNSTVNASWNATDYIGAANIFSPHNLDLGYVDVTIIQLSTGREVILDPTKHINKIANGVFSFVIPPNFLDVEFVDEDASDAVRQYGSFLIKIEPKKFDTPIVNLIPREQFQTSALSSSLGSFRRKVLEVSYEPFMNLPWAFETRANQSGRLTGSIVDVYDSNMNLKQTKIMSENDFRGLDKNVRLVLSPDNVGFDSPNQLLGTGDILRIHPRETYFNPVIIQLDYISDSEIQSQAYRYLMNDVVRDVKTGTYEVYDENGVTANPDGTFDGTVIQTYQIQQFGEFELRKKLRTE